VQSSTDLCPQFFFFVFEKKRQKNFLLLVGIEKAREWLDLNQGLLGDIREKWSEEVRETRETRELSSLYGPKNLTIPLASQRIEPGAPSKFSQNEPEAPSFFRQNVLGSF
jgi:hypothetical protein